MKRFGGKLLIMSLAVVLSVLAAPSGLLAASEPEGKQSSTPPNDQTPPPGTKSERLNRIDFGNTYIIGQSIKSGAVYLLQRKKSEIKSMLKYREDYRKEILDDFSVDAAKVTVHERKQEQSVRQERPEGDRMVSQK